MTIAITGATGQLGRLALAALQARGHAPIALVRDPAKAADLNADTRAFDYKATGTLVPALAGVQTLVLISSSDTDDRVGQHRNVITAAKAAGVGRILYTSILRADTSPLLLAADHKATEEAIHASGLAFTLLRNGWYTENHTGSLGGAIAAGALIGSAGEGRFSTAARADYAEAIAVAAGAGHDGAVYELAGDTAHSYADLAAEVSRLTGKTIPYNDLPPTVYAGILQGFGLPEGFAHVLADADVQAGQGALHDDSHTLSRLIGRPTTPWQDTVAKALA
ncbi:SDR family oxidoreductase [Tabrizicola sp. M-4]|uniref:SDR family oxidoreductase n=1 Tax=Tabrizicola sp. M-4 TaxID=3055847 RepID=UPI003DA95D62